MASINQMILHIQKTYHLIVFKIRKKINDAKGLAWFAFLCVTFSVNTGCNPNEGKRNNGETGNPSHTYLKTDAEGMVYIPDGKYERGGSSDQADRDEFPRKSIEVNHPLLPDHSSHDSIVFIRVALPWAVLFLQSLNSYGAIWGRVAWFIYFPSCSNQSPVATARYRSAHFPPPAHFPPGV